MKERVKRNIVLLILIVGVFGIINTEIGIIGILPLVVEHFNVAVPTAGLLVSGFALTVAISGLITPLVFSRFDRRKVMILSLSVFVAGNLISVYTRNFNILLAARIISAIFQPVYVSMAFTIAADSVEPREAAKAVSKIFIGVSAGMVIGVPIINVLATTYSFQTAMAFLTLVNTIILLATFFLIPALPTKEIKSYGKQIGIIKKPVMLVSIITVILLNAGVFGFFSYISDYLASVMAASAYTVSIILFLYGLTNMLGNIVAGKILTSFAKATIAILPVTLILTYLLLFFLGHREVITFILILLLGMLAGVVGNVNQYIITKAGKDALEFSNGLFLTAANLGTTIGTSICGMFIVAFSTRHILIGAIGFLLLSIISIMIYHYLLSKKQVEIYDKSLN
ncbi:transporter, major facilitator family protein [Enterococcus faecalis 13-SD-W-01]|nr:transporter, major facilitator family protein [Enterococcus faecalis 13-SD-W-01]